MDLAGVASAIGAPARTAMLESLLADLSRPAGELARIAGVGRPAASEHLARLQSAGLVRAEQRGRHRYYRLASADVAAALEALGLIASARPTRTLGAAQRLSAEREARTCYDHLAGTLGVRIADALVAGGVLEASSLELRDPAPLQELGLDLDPSGHGRPVTRACLDWTERRPHLSGSLGATICAHLLATRRIERIGDGRAVRVTERGRSWLGHLEALACSRPTSSALRPIAAASRDTGAWHHSLRISASGEPKR